MPASTHSSQTPPSRPASAGANSVHRHDQKSAASNARPPLRNNFDLEPNPFEQSFSTPSDGIPTLHHRKQQRQQHHPPASSLSPPSRHSRSPDHPANGSVGSRRGSSDFNQNASSPTATNTNKPLTKDATNEKTVLPPVAALASPSDPSSAWGMPHSSGINSLRSGPLSPAMLAGPQNAAPAAAGAGGPAFHHASSSLFDSTFRTGLTPSTGLTPAGTGLTPAGVIGGPVSFPPPSPNTAVFLAMVNGSAPLNGAPGSTITPNTLSALFSGASASGPAASGPTNNGPPTAGINPAATTSAHPLSVSHVPPTYDNPGAQNGRYANGDSNADYNMHQQNAHNAANTAANGLFLLSQAHQELTKREKEAQSYNAAVSDTSGGGGGGGGGGAGGGGRKKRKTANAAAAAEEKPASKRTKNTRATRAKSMQSEEGIDDDDDMMMDDDGMDEDGSSRGGGGQPKKFETEEEKRRNFLERNRQAALKCRQRKKAWLVSLQAKVEFLTTENDRLTQALVSSRQEISRLSALIPPGATTGPPPDSSAAVSNGHHGAHHGGHGQHNGSNGVHNGANGHGAHGGQGGGQGGAGQVGGPGGPPVSVSVNLPPSVKTGAVGGGGGGASGRGYGY